MQTIEQYLIPDGYAGANVTSTGAASADVPYLVVGMPCQFIAHVVDASGASAAPFGVYVATNEASMSPPRRTVRRGTAACNPSATPCRSLLRRGSGAPFDPCAGCCRRQGKGFFC